MYFPLSISSHDAEDKRHLREEVMHLDGEVRAEVWLAYTAHTPIQASG